MVSVAIWLKTFFRQCEFSGYRVIGTPLNHIIERFPLFAGKLFYKMMSVEPKDESSTIPWQSTTFDELDINNVHQVKGY